VLRRAQTPADRGPGVQTALTDVNNFTTGIRSNYVRVLEQTSGGPVVLVPVQTRNAAATQPAIQDALCVYYPTSGGAAVQNQLECWSTQQVLAGQAYAGLGSHEFGLAPDGMSSASVSLGSVVRSASISGNFFDVSLPVGGGTNQPTSLPSPPAVTLSRG